MFQQLQQNVDKPVRRAKKQGPRTTAEPAAVQEDIAYRSELPPPSAQYQQSALETLAEVSRHHSSRIDARNEQIHAQTTSNSAAEAIAEQALLAQLQSHGEGTTNNASLTAAATNGLLYSNPALTTNHSSQSVSQPADGFSVPSTLPLAEATSEANRHLEQAQAFAQNPQLQDMGHAFYQSFNVPIDMGFRMGEPDVAPDVSWDRVSSGAPSFGNFSMPQNDPMAAYGILSSDSRHKPRGRFDDKRRKEVSEIRKQGACIRCRMLKKPCSGDDPCRTCANLESARIWKGKCLRTRLADGMTLWSKNSTHESAEDEVMHARESSQGAPISFDIEIGFEDSPSSITFPAKVSRQTGSGRSLTPPTEDYDTNADGDVLHLQESDDMGERLGSYATGTMKAAVDRQIVLMRDLLERVQALVTPEAQEQRSTAVDATSKRDKSYSKYGPQSGLLKNVLELWILTHCLTDAESLQTRRVIPRSDCEGADTAASSQEDRQVNSISERLIRAQLIAAMESRCSHLCRTFLNELERRLLQRQQISRFATLLAAMVFLNSAERMAGYHRRCERSSETDSGEQQGASQIADEISTALWRQGEEFADLLTSLLRMRGLPPKTRVNADGVLESIREFLTPTQANGQAVKAPGEEQKEAAADWLDSLQLRADVLRSKVDSDVPGPADGIEAWDLRFVAKVLLPELGR